MLREPLPWPPANIRLRRRLFAEMAAQYHWKIMFVCTLYHSP